MNPYEYIGVGLLLMWIGTLAVVALWLLEFLHESTRWRHLVQLYLEAQAGKQLPVEPGPATGPVSELRIPKDLLAELERREAELG